MQYILYMYSILYYTDSTVGMALVFHRAYPSLIPGTPCDFLSTDH